MLVYGKALLVGPEEPPTHLPVFCDTQKGKGLLRRFKERIHAVDSTVILSVANGMDWAKHRRRKAAEMHLRLNLHSFLLSFAV